MKNQNEIKVRCTFPEKKYIYNKNKKNRIKNKLTYIDGKIYSRGFKIVYFNTWYYFKYLPSMQIKQKSIQTSLYDLL